MTIIRHLFLSSSRVQFFYKNVIFVKMSILIVKIFENLEFLTFILTQQIVYIYEHCQELNYLYSRLQNFGKIFKKFSLRTFFSKTDLLKIEHWAHQIKIFCRKWTNLIKNDQFEIFRASFFERNFSNAKSFRRVKPFLRILFFHE